MGFRFQGLGVGGLGLRVKDLGVGASGVGFWDLFLEFRGNGNSSATVVTILVKSQESPTYEL